MPTTGQYLNQAVPKSQQDLDLVNEGAADCFTYHTWTPEQCEKGNAVREALIVAFVTIVQHVPPGPDRSTALRKLREARMDANSAITHNGRY